MTAQNTNKKAKELPTAATANSSKTNKNIWSDHTAENNNCQVPFVRVDNITTTLSFIKDIVDVISDSASNGGCSHERIGDALYFTCSLIDNVIKDCRKLIQNA